MQKLLVNSDKEDIVDKEKILDYCLDWIKQITNRDMVELQKQREEALKYFFNDPLIVPHGAGRSKYTTSDLSDTVEWILPNLIKIFASGDDVVNLVPQGPEDVDAVNNMDELVNYQLKRKNDWFILLNDVFRDALLLKTGIIKFQWYKETKNIDKEFEGLSDMEFMSMLMQQDTEIIKHDTITVQQAIMDESGAQISPVISTHNVTVRYKTEDEYPLIEAVPPEEIGFPLTTKEIQSASFVFHRVKKDKWEVINTYGQDLFNEIKDSVAGFGDAYDAQMDLVEQERFRDLGYVNFIYDKDDSKYSIYECYYRDNDTGEPMLTVISGNIILRHETNKYGVPPFRIGTPIKLSHRTIGRSMHDLLKELHKIRTALTRQLLDNIYFSNNGRFIADKNRINFDDLINNNRPGGIINGDPSAIVPITPPPLQPWTFQVFEYFQQEKDYHSGIPRSFQGVNPNTLNKTYRGQAQQVGLAQQRIEIMARTFAEMLIAPLVEDVINLNIRFLQKKTALRVTNQWIDISPDNITNRADVIVNVGIGSGEKDTTIMYMQQLLGLYAQIYKAGMPIVTAQNAYSAMKELIKSMGYRNIDDFITNPESIKAVQGLLQAIQQHMMQMQQKGLPPDTVLMQAVQQAMLQMGVKNNNELNSGTNPNQATPQQPMPPMQPMNPQIMTPGGGYFG